MGENLKKIVYAGITIATGAAGYLIGKYRNSRRFFSTTALGLVLIMCAPRGFDLAEKYMILHHDLKKQELNRESKKDSIDAILEAQYPTNKLTNYLDHTLKEISNTNSEFKKRYESAITENEHKYQKSLDSAHNQNAKILNTIDTKLTKQNNLLSNRLNKLQNNFIDSENSYTNTNINEAFNNKRNDNNKNSKNNTILEQVTNNSNTKNKPVNYYLIDVDKSDRFISVYAVYNDGSTNSLNISSKASFPSNGGPDDGNYYIKDKGARAGELFPGFLSINDPIGISGAGEYNQYLEDIQNGLLTNKTGIRVPNDIYNKLAQVVNTKETIINIHD